MRIDAFTHFYPPKYYKRMEEVGAGLKDMFRRARAVQSIHDLDTRRRVVEQFPDYAQVLSIPMPTLETVSQGNADIALELARLANDGLAELVAKHPEALPGLRRPRAADGARRRRRARSSAPSRTSAPSARRSSPTSAASRWTGPSSSRSSPP